MFARSYIILFLTLCASVTLFAQGTTAVGLTAGQSSLPSVVDLTRLFTETTVGQHDPFQVLPSVASLGDKVVPQLRGFLFETPVIKFPVLDSTGAVVDSVIAPPPNRIYGALALDLIGTPAAYQVLTTAARTDTNCEVRASALKSFATNNYYRVMEGSLLPDNEVLHLLLGAMDDTTYVKGCFMKMGDIARQGLKNWTGVDYGEVLPDSLRVNDEKTFGMALAQYREQWWQKNSVGVQWNKDTRCFDLPKSTKN